MITTSLEKIFKLLRGFFKTLIFRVGLKKFKASGWIFFSKNVCFNISKKTDVFIGKKFSVESGTLIAARRNSCLIIGDSVYVNRNCIIVAREKIVLENGVTIGPNCCIYDHDHDMKNRGEFISKPVVIGENSWIGAGCIILKGVTIGRESVIGAGTIVTKDVPEKTMCINKLSYVKKSII